MVADLDALLNRMLADADGKEDPATRGCVEASIM
jgi:hypothetical protein